LVKREVSKILIMNLNDIRKIVEKWIKGSWEKQLKVFMKNEKTKKYFNEALKNSRK